MALGINHALERTTAVVALAHRLGDGARAPRIVVRREQHAADPILKPGVPLAVEPDAAEQGITGEHVVVLQILRDQDLPRRSLALLLAQVPEQREPVRDVGALVIIHTADVGGRVQPETVGAELVEQHHGVVADVSPHLAAAVVGALAEVGPGAIVGVEEHALLVREVPAVELADAVVKTLRSPVVVDDVEDDGDAVLDAPP